MFESDTDYRDEEAAWFIRKIFGRHLLNESQCADQEHEEEDQQ